MHSERVQVHQPTTGARRVVRLGLMMLIAIIVAASVLMALPPAERATLKPDATARAEAFEQAFAAAVTKVRAPGAAGEEWAIMIEPSDINAWLATRLPRWIEHDPTIASLAPLAELRIASLDGALQVEAPFGPFVASQRFTPYIDADRIHVALAMPRIGRLPLPFIASELGEALHAKLDASSQHANAHAKLHDGRRLELREIRCESGRIALLFATLPAAQPVKD